MGLNHQEEISDRSVLLTLMYRHIDNLKSFTLHADRQNIVQGRQQGMFRTEDNSADAKKSYYLSPFLK